jgi:hypothetical protein
MSWTAVIPIVEKHRLESTGSYPPSTARASENSFSNAARITNPTSASRSCIRLRNER